MIDKGNCGSKARAKRTALINRTGRKGVKVSVSKRKQKEKERKRERERTCRILDSSKRLTS